MNPVLSDDRVVFKEVIEPLEVLFYREPKKKIKTFAQWEEADILNSSLQLHQNLETVYSLKIATEIYRFFIDYMKVERQINFPFLLPGRIKSLTSQSFNIHVHSAERAFIECRVLDTFLGQGVFRIFYSVYALHNPKKEYAIGFPKIEQLPSLDFFIKNCYQEGRCLNSLANSKTTLRVKNFVAYPCAINKIEEADYYPALITRKYSHTLLDLIKETLFLPNDKKKLRITKNLLEALDGLNSAQDPVIHRDIKPDNLFCNIKNDGEWSSLVFADFNCSILKSIVDSHPPEHLPGALSFLLPEHFDFQRKITPAANVYGVGLLIYVLWANKLPFWNYHYSVSDSERNFDPKSYDASVYRKIFLGMEKFSAIEVNEKSHPLCALILKMLSLRPEDRIEPEQALRLIDVCEERYLLEEKKEGQIDTKWSQMFSDFTVRASKEILHLSDQDVFNVQQWLEQEALQEDDMN